MEIETLAERNGGEMRSSEGREGESFGFVFASFSRSRFRRGRAPEASAVAKP